MNLVVRTGSTYSEPPSCYIPHRQALEWFGLVLPVAGSPQDNPLLPSGSCFVLLCRNLHPVSFLVLIRDLRRAGNYKDEVGVSWLLGEGGGDCRNMHFMLITGTPGNLILYVWMSLKLLIVRVKIFSHTLQESFITEPTGSLLEVNWPQSTWKS